ncbi:MAG: GTPase HflX [Firmicutes bacterium]|nr:GTPase HflX [Bacillota bacterium]
MEERKERAILAGVHTGARDRLSDTTEETMDELCELACTANAEVVATVIQNKSEIEAATYMGEGKLEEIKQLILAENIDTVIFDDELSPVQIRNLSEFLEVKVIDRTVLILDIFAARAKSGEGKLQVELAQQKYLLPRLRGMGAVLSRTGGGIGTRGPGETKLESDRRHISRRISALEEDIKEIRKHRELIRTRRKKDGVITACLVGYTNAGKSSLMNALTNACVLAENKLFATLDTTSRAITLPDNRRILITDTVGFIRKLPHHLVQAFKSTLEETAEADVLIYVIDASNPQYETHIKVVDSVLSDMGAGGKPTVYVYNKIDLLGEKDLITATEKNSVGISAKTGENLDRLIDLISETAPGKKQKMTVLIPFSCGNIVNDLHENQRILSEDYLPEGVKITLLADKITYAKLKSYII